jgi:hypothetical protein
MFPRLAWPVPHLGADWTTAEYVDLIARFAAQGGTEQRSTDDAATGVCGCRVTAQHGHAIASAAEPPGAYVL